MNSKNIPKTRVAPQKKELQKLTNRIPSPEEIVAHLDQYIIGQQETKRTLAIACYCHLHACLEADRDEDFVWPDNHTLIAGPSGSGKSETIKILCAFLKIPHYQIDCTNLSPNGYKGRNIESVIGEIEKALVKDDDSTPPSIVIWDEIDKIWDDGSEAGRYHRMIQADCLKLIEGGKVSDSLNTSRILHIGCGAFVGMDKIRFPAEAPRIGFNSAPSAIIDHKMTHKIDAQHFIKFGLMAELVGRFSRFSAITPLAKADVMKIMLDSKISFLRRKIEQFESHGTKLIFTDDAIDELAEIAMSHPSGVRGLRQLISNALTPWDFKLADLGNSGIREIRYHREAIHDGSKTQVVVEEPFIVQLKELDEAQSADDDDIFIF